MNRKSSLTRVLLSGACFAIAGGSTIFAQDASAQQSGDTSANNTEEIVVTAQRREQAIQDVPIAVSALNANQLQDQGLTGGYDLLQAVPNVSFSKGNFTGYNFQIRGVGALVVAAGADAGVSIHLNNAPLTANRLFEADFYDVERVEVLRGPQGTLYGRNATGGVVNVISHQPGPDFEATLKGEWGNYNEQRYTAILNVPLADNLAFRIAATDLNRDGFGHNVTLHQDIDGRELWAARATLAWQPTDNFSTWLMWEHFDENDNRARVGKQLCQPDPGPTSVNGNAIVNPVAQGWFSQGCSPSSLYSSSSLGSLNSLATLGGSFGAVIGLIPFNAYAGIQQDPNLRNLSTAIDPQYQARADVVELNASFDLSPQLTVTSLTSYNKDTYFTFEDYNRLPSSLPFLPVPGLTDASGVFCDPQVGCDNHFRTFDISSGDTTQWTEEVRFQSNFDGPFNFDIGANYLDFKLQPSDYFVFSNTLTATTLALTGNPAYVDFGNPPDGTGQNYYDNRSNYTLRSWAAMGEFYYQPTEALRFTLGLRYTDDHKEVTPFAPILFGFLGGLPAGAVVQEPLQQVTFRETTGRLGVDWHLTQDSMLYAFYSRGYKGGGFNPPGSVGIAGIAATFDPEFVNSYEVGLKNTFMDGRFLLNLTAFHYDYKGYQISRIVNRSSVNENIDASVNGAEIETVWSPTRNWRFNGTLGYLDTSIDGGSSLDVFDRAQGNPGYTLVHDPFTAQNCLVPTAFFSPGIVGAINGNPLALAYACGDFASNANALGINNPANPMHSIEGFEANLKGNQLPYSPHLTANFGGEFNWDLGGNWRAMARADYYWQGASYARIYNTDGDRIHSYNNLNLLFRVSNPDKGLTFDIWAQNVTDEVAITGSYLTDDSSGLFRNIFLTEPRTFGLRVAKTW